MLVWGWSLSASDCVSRLSQYLRQYLRHSLRQYLRQNLRQYLRWYFADLNKLHSLPWFSRSDKKYLSEIYFCREPKAILRRDDQCFKKT